MLPRELHRKVTANDRNTVRRTLTVFLSWAVVHAGRRADLFGRKVSTVGLDQLEHETREELCALADRGAFVYFGIRNAYELGSVPVAIREFVPAGPGTVAIANLQHVLEYVMSGGMRGRGWLAPTSLTVDDLAR